MRRVRDWTRASLCAAAALLVACASAKVHDPRMSENAPHAIRPGVAWVEDFGAPPETVGDPAQRERAEELMKAVTRATIDTLVAAGYSARPAPPPTERASAMPPLGAVLVQGRFDEIDAGNAFGRVLIGFGLGASRLTSSVDLDLVNAEDSEPLFQCEIRAKGSKMPGLIVPIGLASEIGLLINGLMKGVGELKGPLAGDARRTGEAIGKRLVSVFEALEWEGG
jgi:hypothetical protein